MSEGKTTKALAEAMAQAHTDLNIFAAVQLLMENSLVSAAAQEDELRFVRLCRAAERRCYRRYENALAALALKPQ